MNIDRQNRLIVASALLVCALLGRQLLTADPGPQDNPPTRQVVQVAATSSHPAPARPLFKSLQADYVADPPTCGTGYVASGGRRTRLWLRTGDSDPDVRYTVRFDRFDRPTPTQWRGVLSRQQAEQILVDLLRLSRSLEAGVPYGASPIEVRLRTPTLNESRRGAGRSEVQTPRLDALLQACRLPGHAGLLEQRPSSFFQKL